MRWRRVPNQLDHRDGAGAFTIRGTIAPGRYRLAANSERVLPIAPIEFALGAADVVVKIDPGHAVAASLLVPEKAPLDTLSVALVPAATIAGNKSDDRFKRGIDSSRRGRCDVRWASVPAGTYALEVRLTAVANPLLTIADVVLPAPAGGDSRLVDIDLRPLLRVLALALHDPDGKQLEDAGGIVFPAAQANPNEWQGHAFWGAPSLCLLPAQPYDLLVCVSGYRPMPVRGDSDRVDVRLDRWPTLTVRVPDVPALPDKARVQVALQPVEKSSVQYRAQWQSGELAEFLAAPRRSATVIDGAASVPISDGLYTLRVSINGNRRSHAFEGTEPQQVLSTAGEVTVTVPKEQWTKGIEIVKQPPKGEPQQREFPFPGK
jgi:hypothetical protein